MNKKIASLAFGAAFLTMGMSMPSCPGQQAMQQQIDGLQTKNTEMTKQMQALDSQIRAMSAEMNQVKTLLAQVSNTVLAQKQAIEQMDTAIKAATAKPVKASAKPAPKKHR